MLEKSMYDLWAIRMLLFIKGKKYGRMMLDSIDNGQLVYLTAEENRQARPKKYYELTEAQLQDDCDFQATNIILYGLPPDVYTLVNHQEAAKDIWDRVKLLMKGTELSYQEHECRLYNLFDKFAYSPQHSSSSMYPPPQQFTPVYAAPIHHQYHYALVNPQQHSVCPQPFISPSVTQHSQADFSQLDSGLDVPTFQNNSIFKVLKDTFNAFDKTLLDEITEVQTVFYQMEAVVDQCSAVENSDLNAQLQEKVFAIAALKNELRKLKGKNVIDTTVSKPNATIAPGMFKLDIEPISHRLKNNRDAHEVYLEKNIENTKTLRGFVVYAKIQNPSEPLLESAYIFKKHVQELLVYVSKTCPSLTKPCEKSVVVTPINKDKKVRFAEPITSLSSIPKQTDSLKTKDSNTPLLTSTGVKPTTSASGSKPSGNTKNNRITRPLSSNQKNKVEDHFRKVKSSLNKMNSIFEPVCNAHVKHSVRNDKFESTICNKCLFDTNNNMCVIDYVNDVNVREKSKSK
uniref:Integrase, catalytic region, zinc finger, CCHC-type, peptidase aspartic, catalytic n=1 Tax=Tanacetum cinerariifolium TaxID=118510 RepID=A0A6L2N652_TANCI|nr:hypothetical protein [Tanacetum cinerariifolium]